MPRAGAGRGLAGREELLDYCAEHNMPVPLTKKSPYSIDENLWGRTNECGILEDPWVAPPDDAYESSSRAEDAPDEAQTSRSSSSRAGRSRSTARRWASSS